MGIHSIQFRGLVIRVIPSSEADLVVAVLAEDGEKHVTLAKQARKSRKRFGSSLDLFDFGRFEASQGKGGLPLLQSFIPEVGLKNLRNSLAKIACASVLAEVTDLLVPEAHGDTSHAATFSALMDGIRGINNCQDLKCELKSLYQALTKILQVSGYHDPSQAQAPSLHALRSLLIQGERSVERKLRSKETLEMIAAELR